MASLTSNMTEQLRRGPFLLLGDTVQVNSDDAAVQIVFSFPVGNWAQAHMIGLSLRSSTVATLPAEAEGHEASMFIRNETNVQIAPLFRSLRPSRSGFSASTLADRLWVFDPLGLTLARLEPLDDIVIGLPQVDSNATPTGDISLFLMLRVLS